MFDKKAESKLARANSPDWPMPDVEHTSEPTFLFLLTPPYSGSTAAADFMAQSKKFGKLQKRYEGQWLIKGLCTSDRWTDSMYCNYESIRRVWLKKFSEKKKKARRLKFIIEKSPPNMVRHRALASLFNDVRVVCYNRNPYANIASAGYRRHGLEEADRYKRVEFVENIARRWLQRSDVLRSIIEKENYPLITYEQFCLDPIKIFEKFEIDSRITEGFHNSYEVAVKDYPKQKIANMNVIQISRFSEEEKIAISNVLEPQKDLVKFFGYDLEFKS